MIIAIWVVEDDEIEGVICDCFAKIFTSINPSIQQVESVVIGITRNVT